MQKPTRKQRVSANSIATLPWIASQDEFFPQLTGTGDFAARGTAANYQGRRRNP